MQTQITCPNCGTPYMADVYQIIDVGRQPQLKELLLSGQLNFAVCPNCGAGGRVATPMLYHDPLNELFMVYVPQEMNLDQRRREELIGRLVKQAMDQTPQEQRRGYMLQPLTMLTMQSFMEKVLATEGITPEMMARQQKQVELLRTLITASPDVVDYLLKERASEIDETFFTILRAQIEMLANSPDANQVVPLLNLQAKLMTDTPTGRELEKRQMAMHALARDARAQNGLTPDLLLKHILLNKADPTIVTMLAQNGLPAMNYEFFTLLTAEIDKLEKAGKIVDAVALATMRDSLLTLQQEMREASEEILREAQQTLDSILAADDMETALLQNVGSIDEAFLHVLGARMDRAEQAGQTEELAKLQVVEDFIVSLSQTDIPPEMEFLNDLAILNSAEDRAAIIAKNPTKVTDDLIGLVDALVGQAESANQKDLAVRLADIRAELVAARA